MPEETGERRSRLDLKTIAIIVSFLVMGAGLVAQWATNKVQVSELIKDVTTLQQQLIDYKEKNDEKIVEMRIDITSSRSDVVSIKDDIKEIKADVKSLVKSMP